MLLTSKMPLHLTFSGSWLHGKDCVYLLSLCAEPDKGQKREVQPSGRNNLSSTMNGAPEPQCCRQRREPATGFIWPYMNPCVLAPIYGA